jgi:hypothetical protein
MFKLSALIFTLVFFIAPTAYAQTSAPAEVQKPKEEAQESAIQPESQPLPMMREYRGAKLGMTQEEVKSVIGKISRTGKNWDEFKLGNDDLMTVHYDDQHLVKTIQLYFADAKHAPSWTDVVGKAQILETPSGSKHARAENRAEKFWVTMFQSKSGTVTTITISR